MLNKIVVMGRLGKDPELRNTPSGTPVTRLSLAVDRDFKDKESGEKITDWIDVVAWRQTAEFATRYLSKGRMIVVEGRLQMRDWTDAKGNKHRSAEIVAENIYFADSKQNGDGGSYQPGYQQGAYQPPGYGGGYAGPAVPTAPNYDGFQDVTDDAGDLPF